MQKIETHYMCVHTFFEKNVKEGPDVIALVYEDAQISYGELNARANQLASYLRLTCNAVSQNVGFYLERTPEMIITLLAILKAGCAYVPLALDYPVERIQYMLADAEISLVLTHSKFYNTLMQMMPTSAVYSQRIKTVLLDQVGEDRNQGSRENLELTLHSNDIAYITYTSGSTGKPKASLIPHQSVCGFHSDVTYANFDADAIFLQYSSIPWDALTLELWAALLHGARCVLYTEDIFLLSSFGLTLERYHITLLWLTSTLFNVIIDEASEILQRVQQLLIGGEALSVMHVRRALAFLPETRIINGYGPSECTVFACCYPIPRTWDSNLSTIPIGYPIGDRVIYLLDEKFQPVPVGTPGEIYIAGPSLALGYLHQPEITAQCFVPHPFASVPGARLYKTGDIARVLSDGSLDFVGRLDQQLKIRGFRVEIGEIEAILGQHELVQQVVVRAHCDPLNTEQLVAYVVLYKHLSDVSIQYLLRSFLALRLPNYMIPAAFIILERFPMTSHGKVDYKALPSLDWSQIHDAIAVVPPENQLEMLILNIWQDVFKRKAISIHDNFLLLGGHSLLATQIAARLYKRLGVNLPTGRVFSHPTIAELATFIAQQLVDEHATIADTIVISTSSSTIPLTIGQQSLWFLEQILEKKPVYTIPLTFQIHGTLKYDVLEQSFMTLINRHEILRTTFQVTTGEQAPENAALRTFLQDKLSEQMLPTHYIRLVALPLTYNGKIDRRALPLPSISEVPEVPESETTRAIANASVAGVVSTLWLQLLHRGPDMAPQANFFELGGHSLIAAQLIWQLREILQVDIPLRKIFEEPTLTGFTAVVQQHVRQHAQVPVTVDVIQKVNRDEKEELLSRVEQMSGEEIDQLLKDLLEGEEEM